MLRHSQAAPLAAILLLMASGVAAAPCTFAAGCDRCSRDGKKCVECYEGHALAVNGTCVKCTAPDIGDGPEGFYCAECSATKPSVCLRCQNYDDYYTNAYITRKGRCSFCPDPGCYKCQDGTGLCLECDSDVMVGKRCKECAVQGCASCRQGSDTICRMCDSFHALVKGSCVPCADTLCRSCPGNPSRCTECDSGAYPGLTLNSGTGRCMRPPCVVKNCQMCAEGDASTCSLCLPGYTSYYGDGAAAPQCSVCDSGYARVGQRCVPCPENCVTCRGGSNGATVCQDCIYRNALVKGKCVQCKDAFCSTCPSDPAKCTECDAPGVKLDKRSGRCVRPPCTVSGCLLCHPRNLASCTLCAYGFYYQDNGLGQIKCRRSVA